MFGWTDFAAGFTFDLQVCRTLGVSGGVCHFTGHRDFTVVQDQRVFPALLDDVNILLNHVTSNC